MASKGKSKKSVSKIPPETAERIVAMALQHPERGARRLVPLLKKKRISVSATSIQNILRREGLQTRQKRMAKFERTSENARKPESPPKKPAAKVSDEAAERIVDISLQNPDFGAKRLLPLLQKEDLFVSASAVYKILKRNNIENRQKRLLKLEEQQPAETPPATAVEGDKPAPAPAADEASETVVGAAFAAALPPGGEEAVSAEEPQPAPEPAVVPPISGASPPVRKAPLKSTRKRSHWAFYLLYLLLFVLIGYLGFHAVQAMQYARLETETTGAPGAAGVRPAPQTDQFKRPLSDYQVIWKRNLFNIAAAKDSSTEEKISLDKIALAKKDLGLELVGTVVANDPRMSRAIIDNRKTREQEAYREGDSAGKVKIKKILRNNVVITTAKGDELLTVEIKESSKRSVSSAPLRNVGSRSSSGQQTAGRQRRRARVLSIRLKQNDVEKSLSDIDAVMEQLRITPYMQGNQPSGFRISRIPANSVLRKMGLRSRDVIVGVDDEDIADPDQAPDFFQRLAAGEEVTIRFKRRRRTRQIKINFE